MQPQDLGDPNMNYPDLPPFPNDVPTAPLLRLSLERLLAGDKKELDHLFKASVEIGFFYLDFQDSQLGTSLLQDVDKLFGVGKELFELSLEEKNKYDFSKQNSYFGYKAQGVALVDKEGNLDRNEFYNVSQPPFSLDFISDPNLPPNVIPQRITINRFQKTIFSVSQHNSQHQTSSNRTESPSNPSCATPISL
jgi:isopenicillin N synthase-like dioxygenase